MTQIKLVLRARFNGTSARPAIWSQLGRDKCPTIRIIALCVQRSVTVTRGSIEYLHWEYCMAPHTSTSGHTHITTLDLLLPPRSPHLDIPQAARRLESPGLKESLESGSTSSYLVISGGTGCNAICAAFDQRACYVLPVSDDGGSSSEIIRVLGGPSIGNPSPLFPHRSMYCTVEGRNCQGSCIIGNLTSHTYSNAQVTSARVSYV